MDFNTKIAYISYEDKGTFASTVEDEDKVLFDFLKNKGLQVERVIWDDPQVDWASYPVALIKSPWDYFVKYPAFLAWLEKLKQLNIRLLNPADIVTWNTDKHYLAEIEAAGLKVIPTTYLHDGDDANLSRFLEKFDGKFIVKPAVSGGSINTFKVTGENITEIQEKIDELLPQMDFMIQPFLPEVPKDGEWSFLFFNGKFSHALLKRAKAGDFRVQHYLGGQIFPQQPEQAEIDNASKYVEQFAKGCLYARVDGVYIDGVFHLMELELIEPFLFLFTHKDGYENYYTGLKAVLEG